VANPFAVAARQMHAPDLRPRGMVYQGAQGGRLNGDWLMSRLSADQTLRADLQILRNRARDLVMNNSSAAAIPRIFSENVVGKDGIKLQGTIGTVKNGDVLHGTINNRVEEAWAEWCEAGNCTADGRSSLVDVLTMIAENEPVEGEVLIRHVRGFNNPWGYAIELIDPDQLDNYYNIYGGPGQNQIRMGVEQDSWGRPLKYHLWTQHPSEPLGRIRTPVAANEIEHVYSMRRARQSRGVTWLAPVVFDLKMLGGYREAELVAARAASAKMGFLESTGDSPALEADVEDGATSIPWQAEPGSIEQLPVGISFKEWDPKHPTNAFEAFDKSNMRSIATACRLSYMSLSGDLQGTSYGSGRIGLLAEQAVFKGLQQRMIRRVLTPIYRAWLKESLLTGALTLGSFDPKRFWSVRWNPRSFPWIDPQKDIQTNEKAVGMGIDTLTRLAAEEGREYEDVILEREREIEFAKLHNVPLILSTGMTDKPVNVDTEAQEEADQAGSGAAPDEPDDTPAPTPKPAKKPKKPGASSEEPNVT
jgi:lambda family phage portal protein